MTRQQNNQAPMKKNEVISAEQKIGMVMEELRSRELELAGVLPNDVKWEAFLALINQALRNSPKLIRCTFPSIVNACVKAAYDGLRVDGREAAIVDSIERYKDEGNVWKERAVARYMPMVFGLIKQILQSGAAKSVKAVIVYQKEVDQGRFTLLEGTTPGIHHQPILTGDKGEMVGAYAVAQVAADVFKFEWMDKHAILDVKKEAKTSNVWDRWPTEMWKKTAVRRLRKSLSGTSMIRDMEAAAEFPQFDRSTPHPQLAPPAQSRPTRAAIADQSGTSNGVSMDFGHDDDGVVIEQERDEPREEQQRQQQQREPAREQNREPQVQLPEDDAAWDQWALETEEKIERAKTAEQVDQIVTLNRPFTKAAAKPLRDRITKAATDRNTELALEASGSGSGDAI